MMPGVIIPQTKISYNGNVTSIEVTSKTHDQITCTFVPDHGLVAGNLQIFPSLMNGDKVNISIVTVNDLLTFSGSLRVSIGNTTATPLQNALIQRITINTAPGFDSGESQPFGGYTEWDVANCSSVSIGLGGPLQYTWDIHGSGTPMPWDAGIKNNANIASVNVDIGF